MKELVELIAKKLVDHPEDVQIRVIESDRDETLELRVHADDMGKVIGKNGKTAKAIRTLLSSACAKVEKNVSLSIVE